MSATAGAVSVESVIDGARLGPFHYRLLAVAASVMLFDGYDIAAMGFVVPAISSAWGMPASAFGLALSGAMIGIALGSMAGGAVGDRWGRRRAIISFFVFGGLSALATTQAQTLPELVAARVATGIGMGGVIPNILALVSEYMPRERRAFLTVLVYSAAGMGSVVGSQLAAALMPAWGWQVVFVIGGIAPLVLALVAYVSLPDPLHLLLRRGDHDGARRIVRQIDPALGEDVVLLGGAKQLVADVAPIRLLFEGVRRYSTLLLWLMFIGTQALVFFLGGWLATLLVARGFGQDQALYALSFFNLGSLAGGWVLAWQSDRRSPEWLLAGAYGGAVLALAALASFHGPVVGTYVICTFAGATIIGASYCLGSLAASYYPPKARATGLGWGLGVGRAGSIASPLLAGVALGAGWTTEAIISAAIIPAAVCAAAVVILGMLRRRLTAFHDSATAATIRASRSPRPPYLPRGRWRP
jgi:AAHS family 4-hydroxybenzoate transporter-like MFS transporter